jgi:hypothetical protein
MRLHSMVVACALMVSPITAQAGWFDKPEPVNMEDLQSILKMLKPVSNGSSDSVYVSVRADGTVFISLKLPNGQTVLGYSGSVKSAMHDLLTNMDEASTEAKSASDAIRSVLNQGKPSQ